MTPKQNEPTDLVERAAVLLEMEAEITRESHSYPNGEWGIDPNDLSAYEQYQEFIAVAKGLRTLAKLQSEAVRLLGELSNEGSLDLHSTQVDELLRAIEEAKK